MLSLNLAVATRAGAARSIIRRSRRSSAAVAVLCAAASPARPVRRPTSSVSSDPYCLQAPPASNSSSPRPTHGMFAAHGRSPRRAVATQAAAVDSSAGVTQPEADTWLGVLALRMLPGPLYYLPALLFPFISLLAGLGAVYAPALLSQLATQPDVQASSTLGAALSSAATAQPWSTLACILPSLLTVLLAFFFIPALDFLLGRDLRNPPPAAAASASAHAAQAARAEGDDLVYRAVLYAYVPLHLAALAGLVALMSSAPVHPLAFLGAVASAGTAGGILFTTAHELSHGSTRLERLLCYALLSTTFYCHWALSHLAHHVKVSTPEDPSSARKGESLWAFIPRSIWGNIVDGYAMEAARLHARRIPLLSPTNRMLWWVGAPISLAMLAYVTCGVKGLAFFLAQALVSVAMLETVNYIEHYGLVRAKKPSGKYERVQPKHSWNVSTMATSAIAFRLQRHSDHHAHASKPYHLLEHIEAAPQMPACYPVMMMLATVPPLWFHIMDRRVETEQARLAALEAAAACAAGPCTEAVPAS